MKTKKLITLLAAASMVPSVNAASILLGGFDGTQTQTTIAPATVTSSTGVRQLTGAKQDALAVGAVTTRIWTNQSTNKEFQWAATLQTSSTTGNWGLTDFTTDAQTGSGVYVITQQNASWINYEITNTGTDNVVLDKLHFATSRTNATNAPTQITITLEQNGTFANPPVLSASPLTALTVGAANTITMVNATAWTGYELTLSSILSDYTLGAGETATFRIANNAGTARLYLDNIAISGTIVAVPEPRAALLGGLGLLALLRRRRN